MTDEEKLEMYRKSCTFDELAKMHIELEKHIPKPKVKLNVDSQSVIGGITNPPVNYNSEQFYKDLIVLINKYSMENQSDTPDYILADYVMNSLMAFTAATLKRDNWWGFKPWEDVHRLSD